MWSARRRYRPWLLRRVHHRPEGGASEADETTTTRNGFNTTFDAEENGTHVVKMAAFDYVNEPIVVERDKTVWIYLVNILEYDPINSFHIHGNFFNHFPTGTSLTPIEFTDTIVQGQAQRAVLEMCFPYAGDFMFHAHKSEFAELGWMGFFRVGGGARPRPPRPAAFCSLPDGNQVSALMEASTQTRPTARRRRPPARPGAHGGGARSGFSPSCRWR